MPIHGGEHKSDERSSEASEPEQEARGGAQSERQRPEPRTLESVPRGLGTRDGALSCTPSRERERHVTVRDVRGQRHGSLGHEQRVSALSLVQRAVRLSRQRTPFGPQIGPMRLAPQLDHGSESLGGRARIPIGQGLVALTPQARECLGCRTELGGGRGVWIDDDGRDGRQRRRSCVRGSGCGVGVCDGGQHTVRARIGRAEKQSRDEQQGCLA